MVQQQLNAYANGRYDLLEKLGEGGMGAVFKVRDRLTGQTIALKRVSLSDAPGTDQSESEYHLLLAQEFQTLASLRHPHIISVLDYGFDNERQPYFTMDMLEAPQTILEAGRDLNLNAKLRLVVQLLQALVYLHRRGILHLDLKPSNVLVENNVVKVLDFGISLGRNETRVAVAGTPGYIAPEVILEQTPTEATDLYAVGVIAYELLTGQRLFQASNVFQIMTDTLNTEPDFSALHDPDKIVTVLSADAEAAGTLVLEPDEIATFKIDTEAFASYQKSITETDEISEAVTLPSNSGPPSLVGVLRLLLAKNPVNRYHDASDVIRDLTAIIGDQLLVETSDIREGFLQAARFVGREAEMAKLSVSLSALKHNEGDVWLVLGETGTGKSRLLDEFRTRALVRGVLVLRGSAVPNGGSYHLWRDALTRLVLETSISDTEASVLKPLIPTLEEMVGHPVPDAGEISPEEAEKRLLSVIYNLFQRQRQPVLLLLEDLQWISTENLTVLHHLRKNIELLPLLIIGSVRTDESGLLTPPPPSFQVIKLPRLDDAAVGELTRAIFGSKGSDPKLIQLLQQQTEGNVFFLIEIVRALAEEAGRLEDVAGMSLPRSVLTAGMQSLLERRLNRIKPEHYPLVELAAIFGRELDIKLMRDLSPTGLTSWLYALHNTAVFEVREERWRFAHDKLREAILHRQTEDQRRQTHQKAAETIEHVYPNAPEYAATQMNLWHIAGDAQRELDYGVRAAEQAYRTSDNRAAVSLYERVIALVSQLKPADQRLRQTRLRVELAKVHFRLSDYEASKKLLRQGLQDALALNDDRLLGDVYASAGRYDILRGSYPEAVKHLENSLKVFKKISERRGIAEASIAMGQAKAYIGEMEGAIGYLEEGLKLYRQVEESFGTGYALATLGNIVAQTGDFDRARTYLQEGLEIYRRLYNRNGIAGTLMNLGILSHFQGDAETASRHYNESLEHFQAVGELSGVASCLVNLGHLSLGGGEFDAARAYFTRSQKMFQTLGDDYGSANTLCSLGSVAVEQGQHDVALNHFKAALTQARAIGAVPLVLEIMVGLSKIALNSGDATKAAALLAPPIHHPATTYEVKSAAEALVEPITAVLGIRSYEAIIAENQSADLDKLLTPYLDEAARSPGN